jgi:uncharacterized integral membrane protein
MKKTITLVLLLALILLVVVFTLQNAEAVQIQFLFWETSMSLAIFMFLLFFLGVIVGVLSLLPHLFHLKSTIRKAQKTLATGENSAAKPFQSTNTDFSSK